MAFEIPNFLPALPEIFVLIMACVVLLADLFVEKHRPGITLFLTLLTLIIAAGLSLWLYSSERIFTFNNMFVLDPLASVAKLFIYATSFFAFIYARVYNRDREILSGDYCVLGLFSIIGMMVTASSYTLLTLFLGLELLSLPIYAMVALWRKSEGAPEAAMKYFVMGALASGMLLYGMSMIYGATGKLDIGQIANVIATLPSADQNLILVFGLVFIVAGLAFKFGAAPFHLWVPDIYEGAPTSTVLFIGAAPKIAILVLTVRLLLEALPGLQTQIQPLFIILAVLSMGLGNIVAIVQNNLKRMLAYSTIAHMGYMLLGLIAGTPQGYSAALFYMITYAIMSLAAFGGIIVMSRAGFEAERFDDLKGLNKRNPWLAFLMLIIMFSLAGIPPFVGFFAKLTVLEALVKVDLIWLVVVALLFSVIGAYYYLRVVKMMYFDAPEELTPLVNTVDIRLAISLNTLLIVGMGILPGSLLDVCRRVFMS
ncbi:MAG: NADH-quinone oxidoreductase subunit NuoN [Gammaproteobacteria bacterium]